MYGIGIDDNGNAFELGAEGKKKPIPSQAKVVAQKQLTEQKKKQQVAQKKKTQETVVSAQIKSRKIANAKKAKIQREQSYSNFQGYLGAHHELSNENQMRNLGGFVGNSLAGFEQIGESIGEEGADFGSAPNSNANFGGLWDALTSAVSSATSSVAKISGDTLEGWIRKVIERRALIEQGDKAFFERMKKLPASTSKSAEIAKYTDMVKTRDSSATHKLYQQFANLVVTSMESVSKDRAQRLRQLFDNPWMVIQSKGTIDKALSGYEEGLGIAPLIAGLAVAGTAGTAAAGYIAGSGSDAKIAQAEIDKNRQLLLDPKVPESVKVEIAKTVASGTQKLSEAALESAKQGGIVGNLTKGVQSITTLVTIVGVGFIFIKYVLPMLQQKKQAV